MVSKAYFMFKLAPCLMQQPVAVKESGIEQHREGGKRTVCSLSNAILYLFLLLGVFYFRPVVLLSHVYRILWQYYLLFLLGGW